jgi:alpha-glucosidase
MKIALLLFACVTLIVAQHVHDDDDWWQNAVFYQVYPRSFKDSLNNDGIGDIRGIIDKLDHLVELGVDGFWMNPVLKSPMVDFGYDVSDFMDVHHEYGTLGDLEELFAKAKEKKLKVILDFVPNHSSDQHQWFIDSENNVPKYQKYYTWHDGKPGTGAIPDVPNNWVSRILSILETHIVTPNTDFSLPWTRLDLEY